MTYPKSARPPCSDCKKSPDRKKAKLYKEIQSRRNPSNFLKGFPFLYAFLLWDKLRRSMASQLSLMFRLLSQTVTFRSVTPFPLKVLRLSGTPESPPDFLGKRKSKETERQFCRIGKTKRVDFALTKYIGGYPKAYGFGSVCPF